MLEIRKLSLDKSSGAQKKTCLNVQESLNHVYEWEDVNSSLTVDRFFSFPALLVVETETFGSHIRIKGKESEHYICMNEKGKIVGRVSIFWEYNQKQQIL